MSKVSPYRVFWPAPPPRCPNCDAELVDEDAVFTPSGVRVHEGCVDGWMNAEQARRIAAPAPPSAVEREEHGGASLRALVDLGTHWGEFYRLLDPTAAATEGQPLPELKLEARMSREDLTKVMRVLWAEHPPRSLFPG